MIRSLTIAIALFIGFTGVARAHSVGIGDTVDGTSATIFLSNYHGPSAVQGGINLIGPGQGGSGTNYAFDTVYPSLGSGVGPAGFTGYDSGPFWGTVAQGWQSVTLSGLVGGFYQYVFTNAIGNTVDNNFGPLGSNYGMYKGSFTISAVPLPATLPLYGAGLAIIGFIGWKRRKAANEV